MAVLLLKAYMCWAALALWHVYAHGWTTTDLRGLELFGPIGLMPEAATLMLAGVPRIARVPGAASEKTPLLL